MKYRSNNTKVTAYKIEEYNLDCPKTVRLTNGENLNLWRSDMDVLHEAARLTKSNLNGYWLVFYEDGTPSVWTDRTFKSSFVKVDNN